MQTTRFFIAALLSLTLSLGAQSAFAVEGELEKLDHGTFVSVDLNNDKKISRQEILHYADLVFLSMDSDSNDELTKKEFSAWDAGYLQLAERMGRKSQFDQAKNEVFSSRDLNGDSKLIHDEFSASALYDFYKADANKDRTLSKEEFLNNYYTLKSLRAVVQ